MVVNLTPRLQTIKQYSVELRHGDSISLESCSYHICRPESKHVMWKMVMQPRMQSPFIGHSNWVEITIDNNVTIPLATRTSIVQKKHELYHSLCIINHRIYISSIRLVCSRRNPYMLVEFMDLFLTYQTWSSPLWSSILTRENKIPRFEIYTGDHAFPKHRALNKKVHRTYFKYFIFGFQSSIFNSGDKSILIPHEGEYSERLSWKKKRSPINIQQKMASSWIVQLMVLLWPKFKGRHSKLDAVELDSWQILGPVDICIYI